MKTYKIFIGGKVPRTQREGGRWQTTGEHLPQPPQGCARYGDRSARCGERIGLAVSDQGWRSHIARDRPDGSLDENMVIAFDRSGARDGSITYLPTEDEGSTVVLRFKRA